MVSEALARVLASGAFRASARRRRLLGFLVEETTAGRADRLKPYAIAVDALGCDETFDPQADPIVRLEVGRLRRDLEHYYLTDGRDDPLRITIPKGNTGHLGFHSLGRRSEKTLYYKDVLKRGWLK
jgi:adenylate cyclase